MNKTEKMLLLSAPDSQLDASAKPLIEKWSEPPTALQILQVVDYCIYTGGASGFVVVVLQTMLDAALNAEGKVLDDIIPEATWRQKQK